MNIKNDLTFKVESLAKGEISQRIKENSGLRIIRIDHSALGNNEKNLLDLAMRDASIRAIVVELANHAFFTYMLQNGCTSFVHYSYIRRLWPRVRSGELLINKNNIVYKLESPENGSHPEKLLVVFSSMSDKIRNSSLMRYFTQNFPSIQKFIPSNTAVLRIADIGGVVGGFYMNSYGLPNVEDEIQSLIFDVAKQLNIEKSNTILYGTSKGGSGALYHSVLGDYSGVAVDPILDDDYYIKNFKDAHFSVGAFPEDKKDKFKNLSKLMGREISMPKAVIFSKKSPQYNYINSTLGSPLRDHICFFDSRHPEIKTHPDVGVKTNNIAVMLINAYFYKIHIPAGFNIVI